MGHSIVVLDAGARCPLWIDQQAGTESNVIVLARRTSETTREFEARMIRTLEQLEDRGPLEHGVLCGDDWSTLEAQGLAISVLRQMLGMRARQESSPEGGVALVSACDDTWTPREIAELAGAATGDIVRAIATGPGPKRRPRARRTIPPAPAVANVA